jgi:hypothetical protein
MENASTAPRLRQIQVPPVRKSKRLPTLHIRRIKLAGGRLEYRIPIEVDRTSYAQLWCDKRDRKATEQRLIEQNADKRVKFYSLK